MKERPILFSAPMVRALLDGSKTQTRRIVKGDIVSHSDGAKRRVFMPRDIPEVNALLKERHDHPLRRVSCPYGQPGDRLWVRETFCPRWLERPLYRATGDVACRWKPSIFMPRNASRITLDITGVRVERLQDISEVDAIAEGILKLADGGYGLPDGSHYHATDPRVSYWSLWDTINGQGSTDQNPLVWVIDWTKKEKAA